jgi:hypothetical protein
LYANIIAHAVKLSIPDAPAINVTDVHMSLVVSSNSRRTLLRNTNNKETVIGVLGQSKQDATLNVNYTVSIQSLDHSSSYYGKELRDAVVNSIFTTQLRILSAQASAIGFYNTSTYNVTLVDYVAPTTPTTEKEKEVVVAPYIIPIAIGAILLVGAACVGGYLYWYHRKNALLGISKVHAED